jgi:hypothetical protein
MSDSESVEYLQPGFDAKSLTIPRLRSILVAHNIPYSSSAKKGQLVDLFNQEVVPQSKKILAARARAKRSSKGIVDAESSQSSSNPFNDDENDGFLPPPPAVSTRRSKSPRKASARIKSEEPEYEPLPPPRRSPSKRSSRASSRQPYLSDNETGPETDRTLALKKTRQPETVPTIKSEESEDGFFRRTSGAFTSDNPFQSSSSPPTAEKTPSNRRRTTGPASAMTASNTSRRRTDGPVMEPRYQVPAASVIRARTKTPEAEWMEPGEEFTPEEQLELAAEEALNSETAIVPTRKSPPKKTNWATPLAVLITTLAGAYAGWYRQEKIAVGYCGVGQTLSSIPAEIQVPEWAHSVLPPEITVPESFIDAIEPECEPCPPHAYCYADYSVRCEQDYILRSHPLSFGGVVPLPPTCEPDGEKARRVQAVADKAVEELRERAAQYECSEPVGEEGTILESPEIEEPELKEIISKKRSKKMTNQEFEELWGSAIGEIKAREEVKVQTKP